MANVTAPQLEAWLYDGMPSVRSVQITDAGGGPITFTISASKIVGDALDDWAAQATADGTLAETYTFDWAEGTQQCRLLATGNFDITMDGSLATALGFSSASQTGAALYTSDQTALAIANPLNIEYEAPWTDEEAKLTTYRWGRVTSRKHYHAPLCRLRVMMETTQADALLSGPLLTAKLRAWPCGFTSGAYATSNLRGYLDVYPYEVESVDRLGTADGHTLVTLIGAVEE